MDHTALLAGPAGDATEPPGRYPLSDLQYAYLLGELGEFELGGPALFYEEYGCPPFDPDLLRGALRTLMDRHAMLRATFDEAGSFVVHGADLPVPLAYRSLRGLSPG